MVGASGFCVNLGLLALFVEVAGMNKVWAQVPSYQISIWTNFAFNEFWTFSDRRTPGTRSFLIRAIKFNLVSQVGWGINLGVYYLALKVVGIHYIVSEIIAIAVAMMWNFFSNVIWTWKTKARGLIKNMALDYFILVFISSLGVYQIVAINAKLDGLCFFRQPVVSISLAS